jgi:hypothetical protein
LAETCEQDEEATYATERKKYDTKEEENEDIDTISKPKSRMTLALEKTLKNKVVFHK